MLPILNIGPLALQAPALILLVGLWVGMALVEKTCQRFSIQPGHANTLVLAGLGALTVGGRLVYAAGHLSAFIQSPASLVSINPSLWDLPGGVVAGLAVGGWLAIRYRLNGWRVLDGLTPGLAVMMIALGLANLASGNGYGQPASLPWSIYLWGEWRHPTQLYESLGASLVFGLAVLLPLARKIAFQPGRFFCQFTAWSAGLYLFLGAFRQENSLGIQVMAWVILAASLYGLGRLLKPPVLDPDEKSTG